MSHDNSPSIGDVIRTARRARGLSQYQLATVLATTSGRHTVNRELIARWERQKQVPRKDSRVWLATVLGVPHDELEKAAGSAVAPETPCDIALPAGRQSPGSRLCPVIGSENLGRILALLLLNRDIWYSYEEIADRAGCATKTVRRHCRFLRTARIITERAGDNKAQVRAGEQTPSVVALTELMRLTYGVPLVVGAEFSRVAPASAVSVLGDWSNQCTGTAPDEPSAVVVDLRVSQDQPIPGRADVTAAALRCERRLRRPVSVRMRYPTANSPRRHDPSGPVATTRQVTATASGIHDMSLRDTGVIVRDLVDIGALERVETTPLRTRQTLGTAATHLRSARLVLDSSPKSAFLLTASAAHLVAVAMLAHHGLRLTCDPDDFLACRILRVRFDDRFALVNQLSRRRADLTSTVDHVGWAETDTCIRSVEELRQFAVRLIRPT
ncbi:helix-turn-helix domain-containing protein [Saccharomonospora sp. NPDC006951]